MSKLYSECRIRKRGCFFCLSELNLLKWHELGNFSNFDKSCPNSIESDPGPFESIIMHFWLKVATQEVSDHSMNDPLPIQKNGQKNFFWPKSGPDGFGRNFCTPKSTFSGWGGWNFFGPRQRGSKALVKSFWCRSNHFGALETSQSRKLLKLGPKMRFCRNFCTPKIDLFGVRWPKFFRPAPKGFHSPRKKFLMPIKPFWGSGDLPESKTAEIRSKNAILQKLLHP